MIRPSPFLAKKDRWLLENEQCFIFENEYPVIRGHVLVIPKREVESLHDLSASEWQAVKSLAEKYVLDIGAIGFNFGLNSGESAGQSVAHIHFHIFPHFKDSSGITKGGICNAFGSIPEYYRQVK